MKGALLLLGLLIINGIIGLLFFPIRLLGGSHDKVYKSLITIGIVTVLYKKFKKLFNFNYPKETYLITDEQGDDDMKTWHVEYYTTNGTRVGMNISAYTALDARAYVEKMPDYRNMANYPIIV